MRLIDADALADRIYEKWGLAPKYFDDQLDAMKDVQTLEWINSAPSIDIVHCSECKHYIMGDCSKLKLTAVNKDSFCSWGERSE